MRRTLPTFAILLGIAGLLPFAGCGLGALSAPAPYDAQALLGLVGYGAVILAFLGGVHWGFGLDAVSAAPSDIQRARFGLGVVPSLIGWLAISLAFLGFERVSLGVLIVGFIVTTVVEGRASRRGFMPKAYMGLRWVLSALVVIVLSVVLIVLLLGGRIVLW